MNSSRQLGSSLGLLAVVAELVWGVMFYLVCNLYSYHLGALNMQVALIFELSRHKILNFVEFFTWCIPVLVKPFLLTIFSLFLGWPQACKSHIQIMSYILKGCTYMSSPKDEGRGPFVKITQLMKFLGGGGDLLKKYNNMTVC